jgi:hypothetical protein
MAAKTRAKGKNKARPAAKAKTGKAAPRLASKVVCAEGPRQQGVQMTKQQGVQMTKQQGAQAAPKPRQESLGLREVTKKRLSPERWRLLEVLVNPENRFKSVTELCHLARCSRRVYYKAYNDPEFRNVQEDLAIMLIKQSVISSIHALQREAARGSFQHIEKVLQLAGVDKRIQLDQRGANEDKLAMLVAAMEAAARAAKSDL